MKNHILVFCVLFMSCGVGLAQIDTLDRNMISMSETYEKPYKVGSVYFQKGSSEPFTGILFGKYDNGRYLTMQEYVDGIGNGKWVNYYQDGSLKEIGTYVNNLVEGPISKFYPNGTLKAKGTYKHWKIKVGKWFYYDETGKLSKTIDYSTSN